MKVRNLLIAALLLGGMTAFNACSDKDEDPTPDQGTEQPAEELETVLAFTGGFGDNVQTRANGTDEKYRKGEYETIRNYGEFVFEVNEDGSFGKYVISYVNKGDGKPIFGSRGDYDTSKDNTAYDPYGFYFQPLKFKTSAKQVAIVVVANCDELFTDASEKVLTDFDTFSEFANKVTLPLLNSTNFSGYPMSSNVLVVDIVPGKYNTVGFGNTDTGRKELKKAFDAYEMTYPSESDFNFSTDNRIYLYRCWSLVKLTKVKVATYTADAANAKFELEEAFVMNVPTKTNLFNTSKPEKWYSWGGELNMDLSAMIKGNSTSAFYSGYANDEGDTKENSDGYRNNSAYDNYYRTKQIADVTSYYGNYNRSLSDKDVSKVVMTNSENGSLTELDLTKDAYKMESGIVAADPYMGEDNYFTYVVAPSNYGKDNANDQAVVLAIKGKYSQKIGNSWYGTGSEGEIESSYYTVVVNDGTLDVEIKDLATANIPNTVMRNVQYEIEMTVKGPGSPTPVAHLTNTYLVPKVTIVPFGTVKQQSEID